MELHLLGRVERRRWARSLLLERRGEPESRALTLLTFDAHLAAHQLGQLLADGKAKTRPAVPAGGRCIRLGESLEKRRQSGVGNADTRVAYLESQRDPVTMIRLQGHPQHHLAFRGELDRVAYQIHEYLSKTASIAPKV